MTTIVVFSSVFFIQSLNELSKQFSDDGSLDLDTTSIILNTVALAIGIALSYWFTQRVFRPIEKMPENRTNLLPLRHMGQELFWYLRSISNEVALNNSELTLAQAGATTQGRKQ